MAENLVNEIPSTADADPTTTLSSELASGATSASFAATTHMPGAGEVASAVLHYGASAEIIEITGNGSGNPYTVARAQESTSQSTWPAGTQVNVVITADSLTDLINGWEFASLVATDVTVNGAFVLNGNATAFSVVTDGGMGFVVLDGTTNGDSEAAIQMYFPTAVTSLYFSDGKISTDADTGLELKSGSGSGTSQGTVYINGGFRRKSVTKTANYSADHGDFFIGYTTLSAARTVTLPLKSTLGNGHKIVIADLTTGTGAGTNNIIVVEHATDGGSTVATVNVDRARVEIELQNSSWWASPISAAWTRTA